MLLITAMMATLCRLVQHHVFWEAWLQRGNVRYVLRMLLITSQTRANYTSSAVSTQFGDVLIQFFIPRSFPGCSTAASSSCWAPSSVRTRATCWSSSGREGVRSWAGSPSQTATSPRPWAPPPTTPGRALTRPSARSTSSTSPRAPTSPPGCAWARCGRPPPAGSWTASLPSSFCLFQG